jgi:hypothetical protein
MWPAPSRTAQRQHQFGCAIGGFLLLFMVLGDAIGWFVPELIGEAFPPAHPVFPPRPVDELGRPLLIAIALTSRSTEPMLLVHAWM